MLVHPFFGKALIYDTEIVNHYINVKNQFKQKKIASTYETILNTKRMNQIEACNLLNIDRVSPIGQGRTY